MKCFKCGKKGIRVGPVSSRYIGEQALGYTFCVDCASDLFDIDCDACWDGSMRSLAPLPVACFEHLARFVYPCKLLE